MKKQKPAKAKKVKTIADPEGRSTPPRLIHRDRKDLELKNYLMESNPEFDVPLENAKATVNDLSKVNKH
jgi:hypothetical protein